MATATLGGQLVFPVDPSSIEWAYTVKTKITNTVGGVVVQCFGTRMEDITLEGSFGSQGADGQSSFVQLMAALVGRQINNGPTITFDFPPRDWHFDVYVKAVGAVSKDVPTIDYRYQLTLMPILDAKTAGQLTSIATDQFIANLTQDGLGWTGPNEFNGFPAETDVKTFLANNQWQSVADLANSYQNSLYNPQAGAVNTFFTTLSAENTAVTGGK